MPPKKSTRSKERRTRPRADARLSMRVESQPGAPASPVVTESQNISSSGVYCTSAAYLAPLSKVALTIVLPKLPGGRAAQELIKCEGIVVRCQPSSRKSDRSYELACMFSNLDDRRRMMLDEFVTWRNLQALRAAAAAVNGKRRPKRTVAKSAAAKSAVAKSSVVKSKGRSPAPSTSRSPARPSAPKRSVRRATMPKRAARSR